MKLSGEDKKLLEFCDSPKTSREISEELGIPIKTVQWMIGRLKKCGLLKGERVRREGVNSFVYQRIEGVEMPETVKPKEYKPLGVCILGVWI